MSRVLLISLDIVGKAMAGPAIRYFEFAKALSLKHKVVLMTPNTPDIEPTRFRFAPHTAMREEICRADVVVCQQLKPNMALWLSLAAPRLIIDAYDPEPLEHLEIFKNSSLKERHKRNRDIVSKTLFSLASADGILYANESQRDLWMGLLMGQGAVTPERYDEDSTLSHFLAKVPFGLPEEPLLPKTGMRQKFGLKKEDFVLLWGGGIWNWFDPLTLIRALSFMPDVKLVFMGIKHPNDQIPEMAMTKQAYNLSKELSLLDTQVFFNFDWTPYEERQAFLYEANIGVSTHFNHLETRYAFRTRLLDYLWAGLPIVTTCGDSMGDFIERERAGISVPFQSPDAIVRAIGKIRENPKPYRENSRSLSKAFTWPKVIEPLEAMIERLSSKKAKGIAFSRMWACL